jgi:hypothetical protein
MSNRRVDRYSIAFFKWDMNRLATGYELMVMGIPREISDHAGYSWTLYIKEIENK